MDFGPTTQQFDPVYTLDALPAGTRLGGYQIIEVLGRGGFGIVYLALDSSLQRQVAIKEYFPAALAMRCEDGQVWMKPGADPASYGAGMKAFLNEAKMLARFDHPSLARVHTFWEENRSAYMVMPFYEGRTLAAVLAERQGPADEAWLRSLLAPLLSALGTLHNANCLHLDISPDNILVLADGRPVLLDFGVASRLATDKTMPLTALLNPAYAPIEQYSESANLQQGPWSDIYALAGVLHFAIAGVPPARATVRAVEDPQRPLAETVAARAQQFPGLSYSPSFLAAIDRALAVRPRDRPRGAAEFSLLLDRVAPVEPPAAPRAAPHGAGQGPAAFDFAAATGGSKRPAPASVPSPEPAPETWLAAEPMDAPPRPTSRRTPMWIGMIAVIGLAAAGWSWLQRQPSFATITVGDLPPAVVAKIPQPVADGASTPMALPTEPTSAGPATAAASAVGPVSAAASAAVVAQAASAAPPPAPPASAAVATAAPKPAPAAARPAPAKPTRVAKAATPPRVPPTLPPPAETTADAAPAQEATREPASPEPEPKAREKDPPPNPARKPPPKTVASAMPPEPATPRAACGTRSNFALVYCMQQQCKRWKFNTHPQCLEMERRGEL